MTRRTIVLCCMMVFALTTFSQSVEEQKKKINTIKKSSSYIYAEATLDNEQDALDLAQELLYQRVNEYIANKKKFKDAKETVIINQNYASEQIKLPRGNMYRAFMFVKKSDVIPTENAVVGRVETKEDEPSTVEFIQDNTEDVITTIRNLRTLEEMRSELSRLKQEDKIASYAKYSELASPENFILIIYNKQGLVKAVLSEGKQRTNLNTNQPDSISNYKGTGAVGVKLK